MLTQFLFNFRLTTLTLSVQKGPAGSSYDKAASLPVSSGVFRENSFPLEAAEVMFLLASANII